MAKKTKPFLKVDLGDNPGPVVFLNVTEIQNWVDAEREAWTWASGIGGGGSDLAPIYSQQGTVWGTVEDQLRRIDANPEV